MAKILTQEFLEELPKSRREAIVRVKNMFYTGKSCVRGHISARYTINSNCYTCTRERFDKIRDEYAAAKYDIKRQDRDLL